MSGTEALARVLRSVGVEIGYSGADTYRTVVAERILADPGPLLAALAEAGVLTEATRVTYEITADVDGERALQHHAERPEYLHQQLAEHPGWYRPGSRVERGVTRWFMTESVTDWEATDE